MRKAENVRVERACPNAESVLARVKDNAEVYCLCCGIWYPMELPSVKTIQNGAAMILERIAKLECRMDRIEYRQARLVKVYKGGEKEMQRE